jgi:hypothetical protein
VEQTKKQAAGSVNEQEREREREMTRRHNGEDEQSPSDRLTLVSQDLALRALSVVVQHRMKPGRPNPYPKLFEDDYASLRLSLIKYRVDSMPTIDRIYADVEELKSSLQHNYLNIVGYVDKAIQGHLDAKVQSMPQAEGLLPEPIDPATMVSIIKTSSDRYICNIVNHLGRKRSFLGQKQKSKPKRGR